jgi:hypothetical protein
VFILISHKVLKQKRIVLKVIVIVVVFLLSIVLISSLYANALDGGLFVEWQLLGFPRIGDHAVKIMNKGIGYVLGQSGNIYHFTCTGCSDGRWELVDATTYKNDVNYAPFSGECDADTLLFLPFIRKDFVDVEVGCVSWGPGLSKVAYAIDDGGRVYSWRHDVGEYGRMDMLFFPIIGGILSCLFSIIVLFLLYFSNYLIKKIRKDNSQVNLVE